MSSEEIQALVDLLESEKRDSVRESLCEAGEYEFSSTSFDSN